MYSLHRTVSRSLPRLRLLHTTSSRAAPRNRFFVYAPDYPDNVARRYKVREAHLADVKAPIENGVISTYPSIISPIPRMLIDFIVELLSPVGVAGMLADPVQPTITIGNETRNNATGSILIIEADTLEEAKELIVNDVYWKNGVVSDLFSDLYRGIAFIRCSSFAVGQGKGDYPTVLCCDAVSMISM